MSEKNSSELKALPAKAALLLHKDNHYLGMLTRFAKAARQVELDEYLNRLNQSIRKKSLVIHAGEECENRYVSNAPGSQSWSVCVGFGLSVQTLTNWASFVGFKECRRETLETIVDHINANQILISDIGRVLSEFRIEDFYDQVDIYEFGSKLGHNADDVQKFIDAFQLSKNLPGFGYYLNDSDEERYREYYGLYTLFHRTPVDPDIILQSTLRVRYKVPIRKGVNLIRCKLHLPCVTDPVHPSSSHFSYDGCVSNRGPGFHFWHFEENKQGALGKPDFVSMITRDQSDGMATGIFNSVWSGERKHPYSAALIMVKQHFGERAQDADFARKFMRGSYAIYNGLDKMVASIEKMRHENKLTITEKQCEHIVEALELPRVINV